MTSFALFAALVTPSFASECNTVSESLEGLTTDLQQVESTSPWDSVAANSLAPLIAELLASGLTSQENLAYGLEAVLVAAEFDGGPKIVRSLASNVLERYGTAGANEVIMDALKRFASVGSDADIAEILAQDLTPEVQEAPVDEEPNDLEASTLETDENWF